MKKVPSSHVGNQVATCPATGRRGAIRHPLSASRFMLHE